MPTVAGEQVGPIGLGLMAYTWKLKPELPPKKDVFGAMRASLTCSANFWNGGEIYGTAEYNSLHLLHEYFSQYPKDAEKVVLSIKGGLAVGEMRPDGSEKNIRRSIDECLRVLDGKKKLDLFECARVDPKTPIEITIGAMVPYVQQGKLGGISLSECSADTIRRAATVHKISAVEVEFSLWCTEVLDNGIAKACAELDIPIVCYSPLGRGFLTGSLRSPDDIPEGDFRRSYPRFQGDNFYKNLEIVKQVEQIADRKGVAPAQIGIAWILAQNDKPGMPLFIPIPGASHESRVKENSVKVPLSKDEVAEIDKILEAIPAGDRYPGGGHGLLFGNTPPLQE